MGLKHLKDLSYNQTHCPYENRAIHLDGAKIKMDTTPPITLGYI